MFNDYPIESSKFLINIHSINEFTLIYVNAKNIIRQCLFLPYRSNFYVSIPLVNLEIN